MKVHSQQKVAEYTMNGTPTHGVKIKTNFPFVNSSQMLTVNIRGYSYGKAATLGLQIGYYIYNNQFTNSSISSQGGDIPDVYLLNEGGKVVIFINDRVYYQRFLVEVFAKGMKEESTWFQGWTVVDEAMSGTVSMKLEYKNRFSGFLYANNVLLSGKLGIGTNTPNEALSVNGNIRAREIKVETSNWPDYVFAKDYALMPLEDLETFVESNNHLPDIPKASQIEIEGLPLGEMNKLLLKKVEELTLYLFQLNKKNKVLMEEIRELKSTIEN